MTFEQIKALTDPGHRPARTEFAMRLSLVGNVTHLAILGRLHDGPATIEALVLQARVMKSYCRLAVRSLCRAGVVEVAPAGPPETYALTPWGRKLVEALAPLIADTPTSS